ncbi:Uncharacterized protein APZ42_001147 [Daphnia magna]|uniref:Uncharacterized protein n=1 Tax=Daphnia magna TaxID=35525 RepID=A0A164J5A5_9CRUS|nr:Uncharacterized protein APZ42_001147 [Daphnia magna]
MKYFHQVQVTDFRQKPHHRHLEHHNVLFWHQYFPVHNTRSLINIITFCFGTVVSNFVTNSHNFDQ